MTIAHNIGAPLFICNYPPMAFLCDEQKRMAWEQTGHIDVICPDGYASPVSVVFSACCSILFSTPSIVFLRTLSAAIAETMASTA